MRLPPTYPAIADLVKFARALVGYALSRGPIAASTVLASTLLVLGAGATADQPLHVRIDEAIAELHPGPESPLCSDGEFLRRVHLDLVGTIPSGNRARDFIADDAPDKRERVIDQLLADPAHARHMAHVIDVMLMERRADKYVKRDPWNAYLLASLEQNKPLNELAREILGAENVH